jgi:hypothetical protein
LFFLGITGALTGVGGGFAKVIGQKKTGKVGAIPTNLCMLLIIARKSIGIPKLLEFFKQPSGAGQKRFSQGIGDSSKGQVFQVSWSMGFEDFRSDDQQISALYAEILR